MLYSVFVTISSTVPFSTLKSSTKLLSSLSVKDFLCNVVDNLNLSAPGAASLANPFALSYKSELTKDGLTTSSFSKNPTL